ncbi:2-dehydro-3-deoxy-6-phosphogalactonate aldolase [Alsobacter soli]|uniref:2-dehydro-3-deoxy-6-phosphogalactonate aldolase n=1 Tax=Alsobacter soli TaxID=2109933 RepID=A0A2T1HPJ1_9HYPH|nr:2-dehydro-3-deoxy-6-phosphogalactonate aldolase [Alsobacter soli]PSC03537.1 2-dehydro-3-deoxy-6-phosphogalactonate aldolase [Alsobacter soli]
MSFRPAFDDAYARCPLIAILRGLKPDEGVAVGEALVSAGFTILEVPLNSPEPLDSIGRLAKALAGRAVVGAGTVYRPDQVEAVAAVGGQIIVSPNCNPEVIRRTKQLGLVSAPGVMTPSEAYQACEAGADVLKFFPGEVIGPAGVKAMSAVLPKGPALVMVGGITPETLKAYAETPVSGFGLGSALYKPGSTAAEVGERARAFLAAFAQFRAARA